jgi:A/G-specific adenine glycosylase
MKDGYFSKKIAEWYEVHHRNLPWRNTRDPYQIWLSEIILQQTRVIQGLPYYEKFVRNYPNVKALARAKEQEVLRLWQGLGYYTRARNLHACAKTIVEKHKGEFPHTYDTLMQLPGVGGYTAAAIASFAFDQRVAVVDGNVQRVLARLFGVEDDVTSPVGKKHFSALANKLISNDNPATHNQAIMEFGALQCVPGKPDCGRCIFRTECFAYKHDSQCLLPVKKKKAKVTRRYFYYFLIRNGKKLLTVERKGNDIWKGLHDFPLHEENKPTHPRKIIAKIFAREPTGDVRISPDYKHVLTHQVIFARFIEIDLAPEGIPDQWLRDNEAQWRSVASLEKIPKPVLISRYLQDNSIL